MIKKNIAIAIVLLFPVVALAQLANVEQIFLSVGRLVSLLLPLVVALALLFFFWGLAKFILSAGNEVDAEKGKSMMIWGIIALFVMVSVWGLVRFIIDAFEIDDNPTIIVPSINFQTGTISNTPQSSNPPPSQNIPSRSSCPPGQVCL